MHQTHHQFDELSKLNQAVKKNLHIMQMHQTNKHFKINMQNTIIMH